MTNITLSINDEVYNKMKKFSEIKWSEFVRICIQQRVKELEMLHKMKLIDPDNSPFLGDEKLLAESWLSSEDEKAFEHLQ